MFDNHFRLAYAIIHSELIALKPAHLYWAMMANNLSLFEAITNSASPGIAEPTVNGLPLLVFAFTCLARIEFAHLLVRDLSRSDKNAVTQTAMYYARTREHVAFCIENGAEVDTSDARHREPALVFRVADAHPEAVCALVACGASPCRAFYWISLWAHEQWWKKDDERVAIVATLRCAAADQNVDCKHVCHSAMGDAVMHEVIQDAVMQDARRSIARCRVDFVRQRATAVCIALHALPALVLCAVMQYACEPFSNIVPFHCFWNIAVCVKHYRCAPAKLSLATGKT